VAPITRALGILRFRPQDFEYSFESLYRVVLGFIDAIGLDRFSVYIQDYGAPIGLKLASRNPTASRPSSVSRAMRTWKDLPLSGSPVRLRHQSGSDTEPAVRAYLTPEANYWQ
jgi:pimeloyl-ACP methyl ester carboxylesterase